MNPNHKRSKELENDFLKCLGQFGSATPRQLALWLFGETNASALTRAYRLSQRLLAKKLIVRRQEGDGKARYILGKSGAGRLGIKPGYDLSVLNARRHDAVIKFLTVMHLQGFNVFSRHRIWRELDKKYRLADGLVLDAIDTGYALVCVSSDTDTVRRRIAILQTFIEVRGIGESYLLKKIGLREASTCE